MIMEIKLELSSDPMLEEVKLMLKELNLGEKGPFHEKLNQFYQIKNIWSKFI